MKKLITLLFLLVSFFASSQTVDTAAVEKEVDSLFTLADKLWQGGRPEEALPIVKNIQKLIETNLGKENQKYVRCLMVLGNCNAMMSQLDSGEQFLLEAKVRSVKLLGKENKFHAACLLNLGNVYLAMGRYEASVLNYHEALPIWEKVLGKKKYYATCLYNLSNVHLLLGRYEDAELLLLEAKDIQEKVLGKENLEYARTLYNLASLYEETGRYDAAELLLSTVKGIKENTLGKENPEYANTLGTLANLYAKTGRYEDAEPLHLTAKDIQENALGKEHHQYALALQNLGALYLEMGNYEKAEPVLRSAIAIWEKTVGKEHQDYASSLDNLGAVYVNMGRYKAAEPLLLEAKAIRGKALGKENYEYALGLYNLVNFYEVTEQFDSAEIILLEASAIQKSLLSNSASYLSNQELFSMSSLFAKDLNQHFSFPQIRAGRNSKIPAACFDNSLFYKGFLLTTANQIRHLAISDTTSAKQYELLISYHRLLAQHYALPIAERDSTTIADLEVKANSKEKELTRTVAGFGEAQQQVTWQEVQQKLKAGEAVIELVHYNYYSPKPTDSTMYAALVLRPGDTAPHFIPLFEEKSLDSLLQTQGDRKADYVSNLYSLAERGARPLGDPQKTLYEMLWKPLEKSLPPAPSQGEGDKLTIYFSPSGLLHRLNIGAIPISDEETLADRYRLVELGSTRQLVVPSEVKIANQDAMLFGGIQYEMDSTAISQANIDFTPETITASRGELSFSYSDSTLRGDTWKYLKWTDKEVMALEPILKSGGIQATTRRGYAATEEAFKAIGKGNPSPRILHVATHGFFFPDPKTAVSGERVRSELSEPVFKISDHPMIRSGLILAGGNHAWQTGKPIKPDMEDGILTAYEISQMNLSNTELVVLSACETGLGDIEGNEGVYGLQRAFKIAGAKYLIMSLWQVPDYQTQELMTTFYKRWLADKMTIPDAFRSAQKEMREKYQIPYLWAGFVLVE